MTMILTSSEFSSGEQIPVQFTGDGEDQSPPLTWDHVPEGTVELALVCDDPDAPGGEPWVHWVLYKIPSATHGLPQGLPDQAELHQPVSACQGQNSWQSGQRLGYRGPAPPRGSGPHLYRFRLYALKHPLVARPGISKKELMALLKGHILGTAELTGVYQR